jgi:hypothetical protein
MITFFPSVDITENFSYMTLSLLDCFKAQSTMSTEAEIFLSLLYKPFSYLHGLDSSEERQ